MATVNTCVLIGRLGGDPELRTTPTGKQVTSFSMATESGYGENRTTQWHKIVVWGKQAEAVARHLRKGSQACVEGEITYKTWMQEGTQRKATEIVAHRVTFIGAREDGRSGATSAPQGYPEPDMSMPDDNDVPF